jgi:transposase InsO family protein
LPPHPAPGRFPWSLGAAGLHAVQGRALGVELPEFVAKAVQEWIAAVGTKTAYIERGSPCENGYIESFNARLRGELLNGEIFYSCARHRSSSRAGDATTILHRNTHLSTLLKRRDFVDQDAIPWDVLSSRHLEQ